MRQGIGIIALWMTLRLLVLAWILSIVESENVEICMEEELKLSCRHDEIIMMTSAEYGRKEVGRCIPETEENGFMRCSNDVLWLLDRWCSGRQECQLDVPNPELKQADTDCLNMLRVYLQISYTCMQVNTSCRSSGPNTRHDSHGVIYSHVTDTKRCGTSTSPWIISASFGQTISLTITDFFTNAKSTDLVSSRVVYGYTRERALGSTRYIYGGRHRERALYTSQTNTVEIWINSENERKDRQFLLKYTISGCADLHPPRRAWYKRSDNVAEIGCPDETWHLVCSGNTWVGTESLRNCTEEVTVIPDKPTNSPKIPWVQDLNILNNNSTDNATLVL